jgi:hypothetical protein
MAFFLLNILSFKVNIMAHRENPLDGRPVPVEQPQCRVLGEAEPEVVVHGGAEGLHQEAEPVGRGGERGQRAQGGLVYNAAERANWHHNEKGAAAVFVFFRKGHRLPGRHLDCHFNVLKSTYLKKLKYKKLKYKKLKAFVSRAQL